MLIGLALTVSSTERPPTPCENVNIGYSHVWLTRETIFTPLLTRVTVLLSRALFFIFWLFHVSISYWMWEIGDVVLNYCLRCPGSMNLVYVSIQCTISFLFIFSLCITDNFQKFKIERH